MYAKQALGALTAAAVFSLSLFVQAQESQAGTVSKWDIFSPEGGNIDGQIDINALSNSLIEFKLQMRSLTDPQIGQYLAYGAKQNF